MIAFKPGLRFKGDRSCSKSQIRMDQMTTLLPETQIGGLERWTAKAERMLGRTSIDGWESNALTVKVAHAARQ